MITEKQIKMFLAMEYDEFKKCLLNYNSEIKKVILNDFRIKNKLINCPKRHDFIWLAQAQDEEIIPFLLDDMGLDLLSKTDDLVDKLNGIITSGNSYLDKLLTIDKFNELIVSNISDLKHLLNGIKEKGANKLIQYAINNKFDNDTLLTIFMGLSINSQIYIVNNIELPKEYIKEFIVYSKSDASEVILEKYSNYLELTNFSLNEIYSLASKKISIPINLLNDKFFITKLSTLYDIKEYRMIINAFAENNDITLIENKREYYYDNEISTFKMDDNMLERFSVLYNTILNLKRKGNLDVDSIMELIDKYIPSYGDSGTSFKIYNIIFSHIRDNDFDGLKNFLVSESNFQLTNLIIDYHFKDVYFNVLIDIKELLSFNKSGGNNLTKDDLELYQSILNLDMLDFSNKLKIHEQLKTKNMVEKFYDDIRNAKNESYQMIKNEMLTLDKLKKYKNEDYSNKYGVDIFELSGESFYAFVKAYDLTKDCIIKELSHVYVDAGSFSLDGSDKLQTFCDPRENYNILYGDFNIHQVVHTYPVDSFSGYIRGYKENATDRVNQILTPKEFVSKSPDYNEMVLLQKNENKKDDELNQAIESPTPIAIYCYDKFTLNDVLSAKNLGIGIVVVNTRAYNPLVSENQISVHDTTVIGGNTIDSNYLTSIYEDSMYGRK